MTSKLSLQQLESFLWETAYNLRGNMDTSDFKNYFMCIVILKHVSDVFEEEYRRVIERHLTKGKTQAEAVQLAEDEREYVGTFYIPQNARWSFLLGLKYNIGEELNRVTRVIEKYNPLLEDVLVTVDFNNKRKLTNTMLTDLLSQISKYHLLNENFERPDLLGAAFTCLVKRFADKAGKKGGEFFTPSEVGRLMVALLKPQVGMSIYDPTSGSGGMLLQSCNYLKEKGENSTNLSLFGQEVSLNTWAICKMNMFLHGVQSADIRNGDTLLNPMHTKCGELLTFDRVIANPPYSVKGYDVDAFRHDNYHRFDYGIPPQNSADLAFLQHMIASLNQKGKAAVILPNGPLFRGSSEKHIREGMLRDDLIEAVVSLPPGLFYGTGIPTSIVIINKNKERQRKHKVLFVDASQDFFSKRQMNVLREQDIHQVVFSFEQFESVGTFCKVVSVNEILSKDANLNTKQYVNNSPVIREINSLLSHHEGFERIPLSNKKLVKSVSVVMVEDELDEPNTIYFRRVKPESGGVLLNLKGQRVIKGKFIQVSFYKEKLLSGYAKLFFESQLGVKMLSQIPTGTNIQSLSASSIRSLNIPIPKPEVQLEVIKVASKLEIAREQIEQFFRKLTTEPKKYKSIENSTDEMVFRLSALSDVKHLQHLISLGETRQMEFKQSFFANVDKLRDESKKVEKNRDAQAEIIKDIVSFLNTDGGILLIGVNDKGKVTGVDIEKKRFGFKKMDNYFQELGAQLASRISSDYAEYCQITEVPFDGKIVVRIDCLPAPVPMFLDNHKFHIRTDTSSPELTGVEMLRYIQNHFKVALINEQ
ncbi:TPA: N-6 DNA methylase [Vibrio parahaemolyticus]|uniref:N-6 DNA methylase n=1 Tax=Vibrio parahaemolyticus TaxID=670 RepID=UPI00111D9AFC|nr:N-6 DNA methylase [Vibrio parahaemolyticus]TOH41523.1 hypothetical protein CGI82_07015 [Vibrio parahaemolyticus]HCE1906504.1 N-6 DNA methylase [Vibrio parahaemolyticus]HCG5135378.1 N-6 DNA methylase [Vibrio parahaemolyticus]